MSFLLAQFMSPLRNRRQDAYGGSLDNRLRFVREVIAAVREGVGRDRVVGFRLSGDEFQEGSLTQADLLEIAPALEATGQLDFIHVGAGPAGLEAARVAARRGHQVSLYEKGAQLGGQTLLASRAPGREDLDEVRRYYTHQMQRLQVAVHLNTAVTPELVTQENPDALLIATGSRPAWPDIPATNEAQIVDARAILAGEVQVRPGQRVVVLAGEHHLQALSTAHFLADKGCQVAVLTEALYAGA